MYSMLLRLVNALLTLLFVGPSVHNVRDCTSSVCSRSNVSATNCSTFLHLAKEVIVFLKTSQRRLITVIMWNFESERLMKMQPDVLQRAYSNNTGFSRPSIPPSSHPRTHTCVVQVVREATARFLWQRSSESDKASKSGCLMPLTVFRSQRTGSTHTHTNSPGQADVERLTDWCRCLHANPQVTRVYFCLRKACACHVDVWLVYARRAAGACVFL